MRETSETSTKSLRLPICDLIKEEFERRRRTNSSYSMRAMARDFNMHPGTLHGILAGNRPVPKSKLSFVLAQLNMNPEQIQRLLTKGSSDKKTLSEMAAFEVIAEWEHYAVLTLLSSLKFQSNEEYLCRKLRIPNDRLRRVLDNLMRSELIEINETGEIKPMQSGVKTSEDTKSIALRLAHKEELVLGMDRLDSIDLDRRDYSSTMLCLPSKNLKKAKNLIRDFRSQFQELCEDVSSDDVYQVCVQLFPITQLEENL